MKQNICHKHFYVNHTNHYGPFKYLQQRSPGIASSFMYLGAKNCPFPIHREDINIYASNHLLWGMDKIWFAVESLSPPLSLSVCLGPVACLRDKKKKQNQTQITHRWPQNTSISSRNIGGINSVVSRRIAPFPSNTRPP